MNAADLLSLVVARWKSEFKGISALEIRSSLGIGHDRAIAMLRELEARGEVKLRKCQLGEPVDFNKVSMGDTVMEIPSRYEMVDTLMAFPAGRVLEDAFYADRRDYGEFTNRLHKGASQVQHYFFRRDVLDKYLKQPDRYRVHQDATGGSIAMTSDHYSSLSEEQQETEGFATVDFGRMKLSDGTEAIGAIAKDLDNLPRGDQFHWAAHEIQSPKIDSEDKAWPQYVSEQFEGDWNADHTDYVALLHDAIERINGAYGLLFRKTAHPGLHVPGLDTYGEYVAAHKELYKLIGPDNLDERVLCEALLANGSQPADFVHESGRPKGKWDLFGMLAKRRGLDWRPFKTVADNRQEDGHRIRQGVPREDYYPAKFRDDLARVVAELTKLIS